MWSQIGETGQEGPETRTTASELLEEWLEPLPFPEFEGPEFPLDQLPSGLREMVAAHSEAIQIPPGMSATLALGCLSATCSGKAVVRPLPDWREQINEYWVTILPPSERKSAGFRDLLAPLEEKEKELRGEAAPDIELAKAHLDILNARLNEAKRAAAKAGESQKGDALALIKELTQAIATFEIPPMPRLLADDATPEAVASLLANNHGRLTIASPEGGLFEMFAGRYSNNIPNIGVYLKAYSGDTLRVDRKSRPSEYIENPHLSVVLTVQPQVLYSMREKATLWAVGSSLASYMKCRDQEEVIASRSPSQCQETCWMCGRIS